jgi:hypothetical protein
MLDLCRAWFEEIEAMRAIRCAPEGVDRTKKQHEGLFHHFCFVVWAAYF